MGAYRMSVCAFLLAGSVFAATPTLGAEVTPNRLVNADNEPGNWLMNHRTYDAQRFSPLDKINRANVKGLKLAYAVALGGKAADENLEATPLAEDGFLYMTDNWSMLYKIDARSGALGRIVWRMDPDQQMLGTANRGAALCCAHPWAAETISSRRPTAKKPGCFTSRRCQAAMSQRSIRRR